MPKTIEYFFSMTSPWSFIGREVFVDMARRHGLDIRPYITTLIEENGGIYSRDRPEPRRKYWQRDLERWSKVRGLELRMKGRELLSDPTPSARSVIAAYLDGQDWLKLTTAFQEAFWLRGEDVGQPNTRKVIADAAGFDGQLLLAREGDADVDAEWKDNRQHAARRGVFGFPTVIFDGEMYWGQDALPFIDEHLTTGRPL